MNKGLGYFMTFALGMGIGSILTWQILKTKYEKIADEEIESVKNMLLKRKDDEKQLDDIINTNKYIQQTDYSSISKKTQNKKREAEVRKPDFEVIPNDEYGLIEEYDEVSLIHYIDGILADDMDEKVENIEEKVGSNYASHFGEYDENTVCIRNDKLKTYYEITFDESKYTDILHHRYRGY